MTFRKCPSVPGATVLLLLGFSCSLHAQGPMPDAPTPAVEPKTTVITTPLRTEVPHKFWDNENRILFAGVVATSAADFAVTRANLQNGGQELNPMVRVFGRSTAGLAINFAGETAGVISLGYFFHKTNHHRLERLTSIVNIGGTLGAVGYGLAHR